MEVMGGQKGPLYTGVELGEAGPYCQGLPVRLEDTAAFLVVQGPWELAPPGGHDRKHPFPLLPAEGAVSALCFTPLPSPLQVPSLCPASSVHLALCRDGPGAPPTAEEGMHRPALPQPTVGSQGGQDWL